MVKDIPSTQNLKSSSKHASTFLFVNLKKNAFPPLFFTFFQFLLTLKHNVKNVNLENVILRWESEKSIFSAGFREISYKKKVIFFVLRVKVKKKI